MDKKQQHVSNSINNLPLYSQRQHPLDRHIGQQQSNKAVLCFIKHARCEVALDLRIDWRYTVGIERPYNILKFKDDIPNFFSHSDRSPQSLQHTHIDVFSCETFYRVATFQPR